MLPDDQVPLSPEAAPATEKQVLLQPLNNPSHDEISPAASALLASLPLAIMAALSAAYWPSWARGLEDEALTTFYYVAPVLSGLMAAYIHLRTQATSRRNIWKCSIWIWTWALLFLVIICVALRSSLAAIIIGGFPFIFPAHGLFVLLALTGLGTGEVLMGLRHGWRRWWTPTEWRYYARQSVLVLLVLLLVQLAAKCHS